MYIRRKERLFMLRIPFIDLILIGIPEVLLCVLAIYSLAKKKVPKKTYFISSVLLAIVEYSIRMLPINFGVHTILNVVFLLILSIYIVKIPTIKAISYVFSVIILLVTCETINMLILIHIFKVNVALISTNPMMKVMFGIPYLLLFGCAILIIRKAKEIHKKSTEQIGQV
jgi:hypothetical protein